MKSDLTKSEIEKYVQEIFSKKSSPSEIKKAKKLAMSRKIMLGEYRKRFCKKCCSLFNSNNSEVRIKNGLKIIRCKECKTISRYKLKN